MKPLLLAPAFGLALSACAISAAASAGTQHGTLALTRLHVLLDVEPPAPNVVPQSDLPVAWFNDQALLADGRHGEAIAAYRRGWPVAVLRGAETDPELDNILQGIFGLSSSAVLAIYIRGHGGEPQLHTVSELPTSSVERQRLARTLADAVAGTPRYPHSPPPSTRESSDGAELVALPKLVFTETQYANSGNGASVTVRGEVVRDSGRAHDVLLVSGKSTQNLKPHHNGKSGSQVIVPAAYRYFLRLFTPDNQGTLPKLSESRPASSPSTELNISESHTTKTSYAFGLSADVSKGLSKQGPTVGAKAAFSFDFSRAYETTNALSFTVRDYSIAANALQPVSQTAQVTWELPLAPAIASRDDYFGRTPDEGRMTPSMKQVTAEGSAVWSIPGTYSGTMSLSAGAEIANIAYSGDSRERLPDPRPQPTASVTVRADSPYLTREVTVFIQSKAGNGGCLRDDNGTVALGQCPDTTTPGWIDDLHAQWQLDSLGRYYNRGSRRCMQILTSGQAPNSSGEIITRPCSINRDQRWEWQADRIHALHGDGYPEWRMFVGPGNIIGVRTSGKPEYQPIPANPYHPLLSPWSSYPSAPGSRDFIPKLDGFGPNEPVADEVKELGPPLAGERWELVVLRQSLHR